VADLGAPDFAVGVNEKLDVEGRIPLTLRRIGGRTACQPLGLAGPVLASDALDRDTAAPAQQFGDPFGPNRG
jgi:hypothetical protein